jgi:glycosyltransferase involved in cell wall biosynthesis
MISVVVPTYNEEKNIRACIEALQDQTLPKSEYEIIIVDGQSKDRTVDIAESYDATVIQQRSKGVGGARNDGARASNGDIIVTTDADCVPDSDWLLNIKEKFEDESVVGLTGNLDPIILEDMGTIESRVYKALFTAARIVRSKIMTRTGFYHMCGANSAFRREEFLKINGYKDLAYADDTEIFIRLKRHGRLIFGEQVIVNYSIRRIKKQGFLKYMKTITRNHIIVHVLGMRPTEGDYAKQEYN